MPHKDLEKRKEYRKKYYEDNKEYCNTLKRKWEIEHKNEINTKKREKYANDEQCRKKIIKAGKEHRLKNKERDRWARIKNKYNITKEEWERIYQDQNGKCFICERTEKQIKNSHSKYLAVDHEHNTGKIRGLLCTNCNRQLSAFLKDDPKIILRVYEYLIRETAYGIVPEKIKKIDRKMPKVVEI